MSYWQAEARTDAFAALLSPRRRAILDASLAVFTRRGVSGASIDEIRELSGASVGSIYHHFGDKDGIAGALYLDGLHRYQQSFLAALMAHGCTQAAVEGVVRRHLNWVYVHRDLARFLFSGRDGRLTLRTERPLRELNRHFLGIVMGWVRPRVERGELRPLSFPVLYALWIGPSQELARHWTSNRTSSDLEDAASQLADAAWNAIKAQEE